MGLEKALHQRNDLFAGVFEHVVAGVGKTMDFRVRKTTPPFLQEMAIENEILLAPTDQHWHAAQTTEVFLHLADKSVAGVSLLQRNVLHETQHRDPVSPRIVGSKISLTNLGRQGPPRTTSAGRPSAEGV